MTLEELKALQIGDIVVLNSGGPKMTVYLIEDNFVSSKYYNTPKERFENLDDIDYALLRKANQ